jgi:Rhodopirellula transposase DDE domain
VAKVLASLVADKTGGDPMNGRKWVRRSPGQLSQDLAASGHRAGRTSVRRLLKGLDYSLKANRKRLTGPAHPDRDRQFRYIARVTKLFLAAGHPVISVDTKKKELIGNFKNPGRTWCQHADEVNAHDFRQDALGLAVPYGIYDLAHNLGYVYVGLSADTPEFAVKAITLWWTQEDRPTFPNEHKVLILADAGGSNGYRPRLWKQQIQVQLADCFGIEVMICHYPTGASKWNPVEHRLFSYISLNWAGVPLRSFETMLSYIHDTSTETGLKVRPFLVEHEYKTGTKVSNQAMAALNLVRRKVCPNWNYVIKPHGAPPSNRL